MNTSKSWATAIAPKNKLAQTKLNLNQLYGIGPWSDLFGFVNYKPALFIASIKMRFGL